MGDYLIISSDWHLGKPGEIDRTPNIIKSVRQSIDRATLLKRKGNKVVYLMAGDMFDGNNPTPKLISEAIKLLNKLERNMVPTVVIVGNHETISQKGKKHALEPLQAVGYENVSIVDKVELIEKLKLNVICIPHMTKARVKELGFDSVKKYIKKECLRLIRDYIIYLNSPTIVLSHHMISGVKLNFSEEEYIDDEKVFPEFLLNNERIKYIINGHIHKPQMFGNIIIPGSIECMDFGERNDIKCYVEVKLND